MIYPKITIVTPSFNQAEFLEETLLSVISQGYPNLEYIVIDGGSTDGSVDIIKQYEKHLTYWVSEPDKGHGDALNKGFARSTGDIMAWINSDDKYFPWTLHTVAEVFNAHHDVNWIIGLYSHFDRKGRLMSFKKENRNEYRNIYSYIFRDLHLQQESVFWRRSLWEKAGGYIDREIPLLIDMELWCRFFLHDVIWHVDRGLGGFRNYGANRSITLGKQVEEDTNTCIQYLKDHLPVDIKVLLQDMEQFKLANNDYATNKENIKTKLQRNYLLRLLPHLVYNRIFNVLYRYKVKNKKLLAPQMPQHDSLVIKRLHYVNDSWVKQDLPYQFPY